MTAHPTPDLLDHFKMVKARRDALEDQSIPTFRISAQDLADSPVDWSQFSLANVTDLKLRKKKDLRRHQSEALGLVREGFVTGDRGKLIMACGTGKTFTALKVAEATTPPNGTILFLAPSISLVSQTLREWTAEASAPKHAFVVCSDTRELQVGPATVMKSDSDGVPVLHALDRP